MRLKRKQISCRYKE